VKVIQWLMAMEERLKYILTQVNDWLKFAEAKNAALLAVNSALIFGTISILNEKCFFPIWLLIYLYIALVVVIIATAICLISFIPNTKIPLISSKMNLLKGGNPIYYGDIAEHNVDSYLESLYQSTGLEFKGIKDIEKKYAEQIICNSRIAVKKFRLFSTALWLTVSCVLTPAVTALLLVSGRKKLEAENVNN